MHPNLYPLAAPEIAKEFESCWLSWSFNYFLCWMKFPGFTIFNFFFLLWWQQKWPLWSLLGSVTGIRCSQCLSYTMHNGLNLKIQKHHAQTGGLCIKLKTNEWPNKIVKTIWHMVEQGMWRVLLFLSSYKWKHMDELPASIQVKHTSPIPCIQWGENFSLGFWG